MLHSCSTFPARPCTAANMEQARHWMWTRRSYAEGSLVRAHIPLAVGGSSYNETWEEQAVAEDAAGHLGGSVWPPRSYSCSFCRREFRSAQALGGHMNVHRRDRARLKQSSSPTTDSLEDQEHLNPCTATGAQNPPHVVSVVHGASTNPNPNSAVAASTLSTGISAQSTAENWSGLAILSPCFSSTRNSENIKLQDPRVYAVAGSFKDATPLELHMVPDIKLGRELTSASKVELRSLRRQREPEEEDGDDELISYSKRRRRRTDTIGFSVMDQSSSGDHLTLQSEVLGPKPIEDLDLELRLGDAPKVKK